MALMTMRRRRLTKRRRSRLVQTRNISFKKYIIQYLSIYEEVVGEKEKKVIGTSKKEEEEKEDTGLLR